MKNINVTSKSDIQVFVDVNNKPFGFAGTVLDYDSAIYIDTRNGTGYKEVIEKLASLIHKFMSKFHFIGNGAEDTKQDIILLILEGIPKYDPRKDAKLSTFLEMRIGRRLINELRDKGRIYKNATFLNITTVHVSCDCGNSFSTTISNGDDKIICPRCNKMIDDKKKISINTAEINESSLIRTDGWPKEQTFTLDGLPLDDYSIVGNKQATIDDEIIMQEDIRSFLEDEDPKLIELINLIYFHDYSIKSAAEKVGLSSAGAGIKLKKLQHNKIIRELFNR